MIYLDHAATTPVDPEVVETMSRCMAEDWFNPSAPYALSGRARRRLRTARERIAGMLGARPQGVVFTSGGSEANNQALLIARGGHAVVGATEHPSVLEAARSLCREVTLVPPDREGRISPQAVTAALRADTRLVSVQLANNETGVLQPIAEIAAAVHRRGILLHTDAVQAFGRVPIDMQALSVDLLSLSGHKLYGPRGIGALVVRRGILPPPLILGGGQEFGLRSGTENVPGAAGLATAAEIAERLMEAEAARETVLMEGFIQAVKQRCPDCRVLGEGAGRLPGVAALLLPALEAEEAIARLDGMGVLLSGKAACATREAGPSHVYLAMGLSEEQARRVIRVSLGRATHEEDLRFAAQAIAEVYGFDKAPSGAASRH